MYTVDICWRGNYEPPLHAHGSKEKSLNDKGPEWYFSMYLAVLYTETPLREGDKNGKVWNCHLYPFGGLDSWHTLSLEGSSWQKSKWSPFLTLANGSWAPPSLQLSPLFFYSEGLVWRCQKGIHTAFFYFQRLILLHSLTPLVHQEKKGRKHSIVGRGALIFMFFLKTKRLLCMDFCLVLGANGLMGHWFGSRNKQKLKQNVDTWWPRENKTDIILTLSGKTTLKFTCHAK